MALKIIVTPKALRDLQNAIDYYNEQQRNGHTKMVAARSKV